MSTATKTKSKIQHRTFGVAPDPIKLDGAFAEYAKPDFEFLAQKNLSADDQCWCEWFYNGHRNQYVVRLNLGFAEDQVTETTTLKAAVFVWNFYCDLVDEYYEAQVDAELQS